MPVTLGLACASHRAARAWLLGTTALLLGAPHPARAQTLPANAAPTGGQVVAGTASIGQTATRTQITQTTQRAAIDWQKFNVGRDHHVNFQQPGAGAWTLNRVITPDPSVVAGSITANGGVAIVNPSGVLFANGAQVNVGSLIASAANISNENFMAGRMAFDGAARTGARVENRGSITVADRGLATLVAPEVRNSGAIRARLGRVALVGAEAFTLDLNGDGLLSIDVTQAVQHAPAGGAALVTNSGLIRADGGSVLLTAHAASGLVEALVSNPGKIEAATLPAVAGGMPERVGTVALRAQGGGVRVEGGIRATGRAQTRGGSVEVTASGNVTVASGARVDVSGPGGGGRATIGAALSSTRGRPERLAQRTTVERGAEIRADATARGRGGEVIVHAAERTVMDGRVAARGGPAGGNGGQIEISSRGGFAMDGRADASAPAGAQGSVLIDPVTLHVVQAQTGSEEPAEITAAAVNGSAGDITLEASNLIRVLAGIDKPTGNLVLQTTAANAAGIAFEAPVNVRGGVLDAATTGNITVAAASTFGGAPVILQGAGGPAVNGVRLQAGGTISNSGTIRGSGGGDILAGPGTIFAVSLRAGGALANSGSIEGVAGTSTNGGLVGLLGANITNTGSIAGPGVAATATGNLANAGGITGTGSVAYPDGTPRAVFLRAGGTFDNAAAGRITGSVGMVDIEAGTQAGNSGTIQALTTLRLRALGAITSSGSLSGADVALRATSGTLQLLGGSVLAGGEARLESGANAVLSNTRVEADTLVARAGPLVDGGATLTLDGASFVLGRAGLFGAGGGVEAGAQSSVTPRNGAQLPAVLFDTRRGNALAGIPANVVPDQPGLAPGQQTTQVRLPDQDAPGSFGAASGAQAGTVRLNLNANSSPVVLLLDSGTAAGTLNAGRLGVHGTGGSSNLSGSLGGRTDGTATGFSDITRPVAQEVQGQYRFNGCVIGLITCDFVPPTIVLVRNFPLNLLAAADVIRGDVLVAGSLANLFVPEPEIFRLRRSRGRLAEPDVLLPNTAEEDY